MNVQVQLKVVYSRENPPPSISVAERHLDAISFTVEKIANELTYKDPDSYSSGREYDDWNRRAVAALSYYKSEKAFVEGWVKDERAKLERQREAVAREAERKAREEERARQKAATGTTQVTDVFGRLLSIARQSYRGNAMSEEDRSFFEQNFAI